MEVSPLKSAVWQTDVLEMQKNTSISPVQGFFLLFLHPAKEGFIV